MIQMKREYKIIYLKIEKLETSTFVSYNNKLLSLYYFI